jgi:hypothetical protein
MNVNGEIGVNAVMADIGDRAVAEDLGELSISCTRKVGFILNKV